MPRNASIIASQAEKFKQLLRRHVEPGSTYCLLDFPDHSNVGDSAIYLGEVKALQEVTGRTPDYVCTYRSFDRDAFIKSCPSGPIFLHGGGNFGDLWPVHQNFREHIISSFPDRKIIQLPQTIVFQSDDSISACAKLIDKHHDFHLWIRDLKGEALARKSFSCSIELSPDAAFSLGQIRRVRAPTCEALLLLRVDKETSHHEIPQEIANSYPIVDWLGPDAPGILARGASQLIALACGRLSEESRREFKFRRLAAKRVDRGVRLLSRGESIITDRLHAHIISTLLDIPHVTLDNAYGKVGAYVEAWTHGYAGVRVCTSLQEALEELPRLRRCFAEAGEA